MSLLEAEGGLGAGVGDRVRRRRGTWNRGDARYAGDERRLPDQVAVAASLGSLRRVHDEVAAPTADQVDDGRHASTLGDLRHRLDLEAGCRERFGRARGGHQREAEVGEGCRDRDGGRLVPRRERRRRPCPSAAAAGRPRAPPWRRPWAGRRRSPSPRRSSASPAEHGIGAGETGEGQHGRLDGHLPGRALAGGLSQGRSRSVKRRPAMSRHAASTRLIPVALLANGTVRDARGLASST